MSLQDHEKGLYEKFRVERVDGKDKPGGPKHGAEYLVLDYKHDPYANAAAGLYALLCEGTHPLLSEDLFNRLGEHGLGLMKHPNYRTPIEVAAAALHLAINHCHQNEAEGDAMGYDVSGDEKRRHRAEAALAALAVE